MTAKQNKVIFDVTGPRSLDQKRSSSSNPAEDISNIISHVESRACEASVASDISALTDGEFFTVSSSSKNKNFRTMARAPEPPTVTHGTSKLTDIQSETTATTDTSVSKAEKSPKNSTRSVSFCEVQIREYERVLEFNPSVTSGPAVGIGWNYAPEGQVFTLENFEDSREFKRSQSIDELALPRDQREKMLRTWGYTQREIAASVRSIIKTKNQRKQTVQNLHAAELRRVRGKGKEEGEECFVVTSS